MIPSRLLLLLADDFVEAATVAVVITPGRLEFTIPKCLLDFTLPDHRLEFTLPKSHDEYSLSQS